MTLNILKIGADYNSTKFDYIVYAKRSKLKQENTNRRYVLDVL